MLDDWAILKPCNPKKILELQSVAKNTLGEYYGIYGIQLVT